MINRIKKFILKHENELIKLTGDLIRIQSDSSNESDIAQFIREYMRIHGFKNVKIDKMGNVVGEFGARKSPLILFDGHMDTVSPGDHSKWKFHPYSGNIYKRKIFGRGSVDQKAGLASAIFSVWVLTQLKFNPEGKVVISASVNEEDCEGMALDYIIKNLACKPTFTVITEPSNLDLVLGQRGKIEFEIETFGKSAHASNPEKGQNSLYQIAQIILEIEKLNHLISNKPLMTRGNIIVSQIKSSASSINSVPFYSKISIDRRLGPEENSKDAIKQLKKISERYKAKLSILKYRNKTWKGFSFKSKRDSPAWLTTPEEESVKIAIEGYKKIFKKKPGLGFWHFSTNGVASKGIHNIPTIGFGPGKMVQAHQTNEHVEIKDLSSAAIFYSYLIYKIMK